MFFFFYRPILVNLKAVMFHRFCLINKYGDGQVRVTSDLDVAVTKKPFTRPSLGEMKPLVYVNTITIVLFGSTLKWYFIYRSETVLYFFHLADLIDHSLVKWIACGRIVVQKECRLKFFGSITPKRRMVT